MYRVRERGNPESGDTSGAQRTARKEVGEPIGIWEWAAFHCLRRLDPSVLQVTMFSIKDSTIYVFFITIPVLGASHLGSDVFH